jgi:23S rRNA (cytosine1962-C5)-methyltransferase
MLANRLRNRYRHLRKWARRTGVTCFRLYERDIPEFPLIVDWYDGAAVAWFFRRKRDETEEQAAAWLKESREEILAGLDLAPGDLFIKERRRQRGLDQYERMGQAGAVRVVSEQGLRFEVNLSDYLDTGLFLDHRNTRALIRERSAGRRVLNLFAYTGSFTCYALAGGASRSVTVDMSRTYCAWTERNFRLNDFALGADHRILQRDCLKFLEEEARQLGPFDLIVCDPPTFSNSKRMEWDSFSLERDYPLLLRRLAPCLAAGGALYFSTNARGFELAGEALPAGLSAKELTPKTLPEDFRNRKIHRCWVLAREP